MSAGSSQLLALARLLGLTPWADIFNALLGVEIVLGLLLEATHHDFLVWQAEADAAGYPNEFDISEAELARMPDRLRRGYIARLIRNVALDFGVATEYSGQLGARRNDDGSLAPLLHTLCEIAAAKGSRG